MRRTVERLLAVVCATWALCAFSVSWAQSSTGNVPLTELGAGSYQGFEGGLYPGGANAPPSGHWQAAMGEAAAIEPLDAAGAPDPLGLVGMISVGMSNTNQEYKVFERDSDLDLSRNAQLVLVNGSQGGVGSDLMSNPADPYWAILAERVIANGLTASQVQVCWLKQAQVNPVTAFPDHAQNLESDLVAIVRILRDRFPNLRLCYLSSRTYGGYAANPLRAEPLSYETGFGVKWLIESQIAGEPALNWDPAQGPVEAPLLLWGPYLWADGVVPRADGLTWLPEDFESDGVHPNPNGERKVGDLLLAFYRGESTALTWYRRKSVLTDLTPIAAAADASVSAAAPNRNFGSSTTLRVAGGTEAARAYTKFDASGVAPAIHHAKLSLRFETPVDGAVREVADSSWTETGVTWNTAPPPSPDVLSPVPSHTRDGSTGVDVTSTVAGDADGLVSLALTRDAAGPVDYLARESGEGPRLVLTRATGTVTVFVDKDPAQNGLALSWNGIGQATYVVRRALGPTPTHFEQSVDQTVNGTTYTDPGTLSDGTDYYYLVE